MGRARKFGVFFQVRTSPECAVALKHAAENLTTQTGVQTSVDNVIERIALAIDEKRISFGVLKK